MVVEGPHLVFPGVEGRRRETPEGSDILRNNIFELWRLGHRNVLTQTLSETELPSFTSEPETRSQGFVEVSRAHSTPSNLGTTTNSPQLLAKTPRGLPILQAI